ncbi:MAG: energy transducer TonB [Saprospiraceae bacterium]
MLDLFEISISGLIAICVAVILLTNAIIYYFKFTYSRYKIDSLKSKNYHKFTTATSRSKFREVDTFKNTGSYFNYGLTISVFLALVFMGYTSVDHETKIEVKKIQEFEEIEVTIPRVPLPPSPPPPPMIESVIDTKEIIENVSFVSQDITSNDKINQTKVEQTGLHPIVPPPPPVPKDNTDDVDRIFRKVEQMPRFPGCDDQGTEEEMVECSTTKLLRYIYEHIIYPEVAKSNRIEGQVVLQFVVDKNGIIRDTKIMRDIGGGCAQVVEKAILDMNNLPERWTPGKQLGRPVKVLYTLPVKFKLE